jgi:rhodanese-related sulfurtransferase
MKTDFLLCFILLVFNLQAQENIQIISAEEVLKMIEEKNLNNTIIIDTRDSLSFVYGHLPYAIHKDAFLAEIEIDIWDKTKKYIIYCRTHNRSQKLCELMQEKGFNSVFQFYEGFLMWEEMGYRIEK